MKIRIEDLKAAISEIENEIDLDDGMIDLQVYEAPGRIGTAYMLAPSITVTFRTDKPTTVRYYDIKYKIIKTTH